MKQAATAINVPFTVDNVNKCRCSICPVQQNSQCVKDKMNKRQDALNQDPMKPEEIPNAYCSQGKATCQDIDTNQSCICGTCLVFSEYNLPRGKPVGYYCRDGKAQG
jgi:hypothetical protein